MKIGIGLPTAISGVGRDDLLGWAHDAEAAGFSSLGTVDRIVYDNLEPLMALAAVAAVTDKIDLITTILITPNRPNTALLAKQIATLDVISGGRLTLGVALGSRDDDYSSGGVPTKGRGRVLEEQVTSMKAIWSGGSVNDVGPIGPSPVRVGGPPVLFGGRDARSVSRAAHLGDGWIVGGTGPHLFAQLADMARQEWSEAGRSDPLPISAICYYALGDDAEALAFRYIAEGYYAFAGEMAPRIAQGAATSEQQIRDYVEAYESAGCNELILIPCSADRDQLHLLSKVVR